MNIDGKLIVASNAEPYKHEIRGDEIKCVEVGGGLATAMNPQMKKTGGIWIAYGRGSRDFDVTDEDGFVEVPDYKDIPDNEKYSLKRLDFSQEMYHNFYRGEANRVLWPILHSFPTKSNLQEEFEYWKNGYYPSNRKYADAIIENYEDGDIIWVHDYHLMLVPKMVREEIPDAKIGFFLHIPWPPWINFGKLPHRREIMEGLASADLVGLHIEDYVNNFLNSVENLGGEVDHENKECFFNNYKTKVKHFPLGVEFDFFNDTNTHGKEGEIRDRYNTEYLVLGVDRLDYTKGIPERISSIEKFIKDYPEYRGTVSFILRIPESRTSIREYKEKQNEINREVSKFNGKYGAHGWTPINLFWDKVPQSELIAEYRAADVGLVTPGLDGMNLVSKEFIASNSDPRVLILSEFAGSSSQLNEAIKINPYNTKETAEAIKKAINISEGEKRKRWEKLRKNVKNEDLEKWANAFLEELDKSHKKFHQR